MADYSRPADGIKLTFAGLNTVAPIDAMPPGKYPVARNIRAFLQDAVVPRLPQGPSLVSLAGSPVIHSLRRLNDTTPLGPASGFALISGAFSSIYVNAVSVSSGFSGNRVSLVSFRPNASPQPWMYIGDSAKQIKVNSTGTAWKTGIAEPFAAAIVSNSTLAPPAISSPVYYRYRYRSLTTGAVSNPSPVMRVGFTLSGFAPQVACGGSTDPQVDTIDVYRFDSGLLDYTYVGSVPNFGSALIDTLDDSVASANPLLEFDNFEPFPSIDIPHSGTVTVSGTLVTWVSGDQFNQNWAPGSIILIDGKPAQLYRRPISNVQLDILDASSIASIAAKSATNGVNDGSGLIPAGTINWTNPANIGSTTLSADAAIPSPVGITKLDLSRGYGFTIPGTATILGIRVDYQAQSTIPTTGNGRVEIYMYKPSAAAIFGFHSFSPVPSFFTPDSAGGSADLWNTTWTPADINNVNFGPGFLANGAGAAGTISVRAAKVTVYYQPAGGGAVSYQVAAATLLNQPLPAWWGPTDNAGYFFACGDPLRPGTLYFTKGNNPDSAPDTNQIELTSPSEPLVNGCIVGGLAMAFSTERAWLLYPSFTNAVATVLGVQGSIFNPVESISERGLYARQGICTDGGGWVYFITKDGIRKSPAGSGSSSITDADLYNLFPHEGIPQKTYVVQSSSGVIFAISPPDFTKPDDMALRFAQGYVYFDYTALDNTSGTLVYDVAHDAWSVDVYGRTVTIHADNEGEAPGATGPSVGIGTLMGAGGGIICAFDPSGSEAAGDAMLATPSYNNGDRRATKRFGDMTIDSLCPTGKTGFSLSVFGDRYTNFFSTGASPTSVPSTVDGLRHLDIIELGSGQGLYTVDLGVVFHAPVDSVGAALFSWQPALVPQPETTKLRNTDWDDGGTAGAKLVQGVIIEADSFNAAKSFTAQSGDDQSIHAFAEMGAGIVFNGQSKKALSFATPFVAHNFRIVPDGTPWNLFNVQWVFVPYPELVQEWHTEGSAQGMDSWQHTKELNIAYLSTAPLTLTLVRDFGSPISVTIPSSSGVQTKYLVQIPPPSKYKIVSYNVTSIQKFRLWVEDIECWVKEWGSPGPYVKVRPFGGPSKLEALV